MRWWALAGRRWRPNDRAHHLPWRRASSSSSILGDDRGACLYTLLGLDPRGDATLAQVKSAFKRRARAVHPDAAGRMNRVAPGPDADDATDAFVRVVAAYEILSCERRRAAYDATRRSPSFMRGASASSSSSASHGFAASPFADSEVLRDYAASIDALVPRWKLRDELYGALAHVIHGAELDVEDVHAGDSFPRYFEAEERTLRTFITEANTGTSTTTRGVDLMHVVAGRTLLAAVREHADAELTDGREGVAGLLDNNNDDEDDDDNGSSCEEGRVDASVGATTTATDGRPDARLELVVGGRVVATATRSVRGGDVVVRDSAFCIDSSLGTEPSSANATSRTRPEASLLKADVNNWGGHPRAGTKANRPNDELIVDAYAARGTDGEVFRISGLSGSFDQATVYDAEGTPRHLVVAHATPGVTHLHWFDANTGVCVGRGTRAWVPPADFWLVAPRSEVSLFFNFCMVN